MSRLMRVRAYTPEEAWEIMKVMFKHGYEGVQNDSARYCKLSIDRAFRDNGVCYIGNSYNMRVISIHDTYGKKHFLEVSKSKFFECLTDQTIEVNATLAEYYNKKNR